ncbi:hypothetical protein JL108_12465 [Aeromicrobium sp. YIM 150415]|uniref:hypothetical protein n=1 Tax=Aeromicrobium sp. YIM 150415 TaxID=2803912 RepID=UPI0019654643|nr:hypothetical protein [Aeromicrobium sp. YIM 150415]MBM9464266.1 hypothetical protein [Aeromicrobium sp. YIM 150415]
MNPLSHYLRTHLVGAAAGIELAARGRQQLDPAARAMMTELRDELESEQRDLREFARRTDTTIPSVGMTLAQVGERLGRLKPNGSLTRRTPLTDLVDLEAMRDAVAGKIAGWQALIAAGDERLDTARLEELLELGERQHDRLTEAHARAAHRALSRRQTPPH